MEGERAHFGSFEEGGEGSIEDAAQGGKDYPSRGIHHVLINFLALSNLALEREGQSLMIAASSYTHG